MSSISALNSSSLYNLLSQSAASKTQSQSTADSASDKTSESTAPSSAIWQTTVKLALAENSLSLTELLLKSNETQNTFASLEMSIATMTAMQQANLFENDPQLVESLLGSGTSASADAAGSQTDLLQALMGSNTSGSGSSASQFLSQATLPLSYSSDASASDLLGSLFDLTA